MPPLAQMLACVMFRVAGLEDREVEEMRTVASVKDIMFSFSIFEIDFLVDT